MRRHLDLGMNRKIASVKLYVTVTYSIWSSLGNSQFGVVGRRQANLGSIS